MKLYIDTRDSDKIVIGLGDNRIEADSKQEKSQMLLALIDQQLEKQRKKIDELTSIQVETGPGSFTGIRVGVAVAQALGWALAIPVNGKVMAKGEFLEISYT